jgi:plasmid stabilization system protein ParE
MVYQISLSPTAIADMGAAVEWLKENRSLEKAEQWLRGCSEAIQSLEQFPDRCARAPEADYLDLDIRQLKYSANTVYRILYTVVHQSSPGEGLVQVHRVRHSAQERLKTLNEL